MANISTINQGWYGNGTSGCAGLCLSSQLSKAYFLYFQQPLRFKLSDGSIKGAWRRSVETDIGGLRNIQKPNCGTQQENDKILQSVLETYVISAEGAVEWQWECIHQIRPSLS